MSNKITKTNFYVYYLLTTFGNKIRIRSCYTKGFTMKRVLEDYISINEYAELNNTSELYVHIALENSKFDALRFKQKWYIKKKYNNGK